MADSNKAVAIQRTTTGEGGLGFGGMIKSMVMGVVIAYILSILAFLVMAAVFGMMQVTENMLKITALAVTVVAAVMSGFISAKLYKKRGWLMGLVCGGIFILLLYVISSLAFDGPNFTLKTPLMATIGLAGGAFGGILGVGGKKKYKR